jgi:hypothetical protein
MLLALGESPRGLVVFHHGALFELVLDGVCMVWTGCFILLSCLEPEIMLNDSNMLLIGAFRFLVIGGAAFAPFASLGTSLSAIVSGFGRCPQLLPGTVIPSRWMKTTLTASSPEVCRVAISRSSFMVFS